jgi:hypothetical protein
MPASRNMDISWELQEHKDLKAIFYNSDAKVGIARSLDNHYHFILTHPEYVAKSIAMEQIRDWKKYAIGELQEEPTNAFGVIPEEKEQIFGEFQDECRRAHKKGNKTEPSFNIEKVEEVLHNHWHSTLVALSAYYLSHVNKIKFDMMMGGEAPAYAPNYKPVTPSGVIAPTYD